MKVKILEETNMWGTTHTVFINDDESIVIKDLSETPEDAIIGRDLVDAHDILYYIKLGYEAGKRGEELILDVKF